MDYDKISDLFSVLSNPKRLKLFFIISEKKRNMNDLEELFSISRPAIRRHLEDIILLGMVKKEALNEGNRIINYYEITSVGKRVAKFLKEIEKDIAKKQEEGQDVFLEVKPALKYDIGKEFVRINKLVRNFLNIKIGDTIEVVSKKGSIAVKVDKAYDSDSDKSIIRLEKKFRDFLEVKCGEKVSVRRKK